MKKIIALLLVVAVMISIVSCSNGNNPADTDPSKDTQDTNDTNPGDTSGTTDTNVLPDDTEEFVYVPYDYENNDLSPYIKLGEIYGLKAESSFVPITDEELEMAIEQLLAQYTSLDEITDRPAQSGDTVVANFSGYKGNEAVDNTAADDAVIEISENSGYIPGFAEAFIGHEIGEDFSFNIVFPEDYRSESLRNEEITFYCKITRIVSNINIPDLETFVKQYTTFESVDEFKADYRDYIDYNNENYSLNDVYESLWLQIMDGSEVLGYPEGSVENMMKYSKIIYTEQANDLNIDYETYLGLYLGMTEADLEAKLKDYLKEDLVLYALVQEFGLHLSDEDIQEGARQYAESVGLSVEEFMTTYNYTEYDLKNALYWQLTMDKVYENAVITPVTE